MNDYRLQVSKDARMEISAIKRYIKYKLKNVQAAENFYKDTREAFEHIFENNVRVFAKDADYVKELVPEIKSGLLDSGMRWGDLTSKVAMIVSGKEVMDNIAVSRRPRRVGPRSSAGRWPHAQMVRQMLEIDIS